MKSSVRPELPTASVRSSQAPPAAVDNSAPLAIRPGSTYKSGKAVETNGATSGDLLHDSTETLAGYLDKQNRYTSMQAEALFKAGKRAGVARLLLSPVLHFAKFYFLRLGFLDGTAGLVHIIIGCCNNFHKYAKLMALQQNRDRM